MQLSETFNSLGLLKILQLDWETLARVGVESGEHYFIYSGSLGLVGADFSRAFPVGPFVVPRQMYLNLSGAY